MQGRLMHLHAGMVGGTGSLASAIERLLSAAHASHANGHACRPTQRLLFFSPHGVSLGPNVLSSLTQGDGVAGVASTCAHAMEATTVTMEELPEAVRNVPMLTIGIKTWRR